MQKQSEWSRRENRSDSNTYHKTGSQTAGRTATLPDWIVAWRRFMRILKYTGMQRHQRWHAMVRLNLPLCSPRGTKYVILIVGIGHELALEVCCHWLSANRAHFCRPLLAKKGASTFLQGGLGSRTISILTRMMPLQIYLEPRARDPMAMNSVPHLLQEKLLRRAFLTACSTVKPFSSEKPWRSS